jgi:hypothetical protein
VGFQPLKTTPGLAELADRLMSPVKLLAFSGNQSFPCGHTPFRPQLLTQQIKASNCGRADQTTQNIEAIKDEKGAGSRYWWC